jgi:hypothetical protein
MHPLKTIGDPVSKEEKSGLYKEVYSANIYYHYSVKKNILQEGK